MYLTDYASQLGHNWQASKPDGGVLWQDHILAFEDESRHQRCAGAAAVLEVDHRHLVGTVREGLLVAVSDLPVQPNDIYVIPPNRSLGIARGVLNLRPLQQTRTPHHSIDFCFDSLAQDQREHAIGVILSGTATDGTLGLEAIKAEGEITFAQAESTRYGSMPRSTIAAGCVDLVLAGGHRERTGPYRRIPYVAGRKQEASLKNAPCKRDSK
jgi:hypothetical protein